MKDKDKTKEQLITELETCRQKIAYLEASEAEIKRSWDMIRKSEELFRMIFENAPLMIDSFDKNGRCELWNRECEKIVGWTKMEIMASLDPLALFYPDLDYRQRVIEDKQKKDGIFREYTPRTKSGEMLSQMWASFELPSGSLISIGYDITEYKEA